MVVRPSAAGDSMAARFPDSMAGLLTVSHHTATTASTAAAASLVVMVVVMVYLLWTRLRGAVLVMFGWRGGRRRGRRRPLVLVVRHNLALECNLAQSRVSELCASWVKTVMIHTPASFELCALCILHKIKK